MVKEGEIHDDWEINDQCIQLLCFFLKGSEPEEEVNKMIMSGKRSESDLELLRSKIKAVEKHQEISKKLLKTLKEMMTRDPRHDVLDIEAAIARRDSSLREWKTFLVAEQAQYLGQPAQIQNPHRQQIKNQYAQLSSYMVEVSGGVNQLMNRMAIGVKSKTDLSELWCDVETFEKQREVAEERLKMLNEMIKDYLLVDVLHVKETIDGWENMLNDFKDIPEPIRYQVEEIPESGSDQACSLVPLNLMPMTSEPIAIDLKGDAGASIGENTGLDLDLHLGFNPDSSPTVVEDRLSGIGGNSLF